MSNDSNGLGDSDFTFSGSGGVGNFTFFFVKRCFRFHLFTRAVGDGQPVLFPQDAVEIHMPPAMTPAHFQHALCFQQCDEL